MPAWISNLYSFSGRIGRASYLFINLGIGAAWMVLDLLIVGFGPNPDVGIFAVVLLFAAWCAAVVIQAAAVIRRLHDIDRPGTHYWLLLVPFYNLYLGFHLLFTPGPMGPNRFGPDPCASHEAGSSHAPRQSPRIVGGTCDDWVCSRCGAANSTVTCSRCGVQNFRASRRRSA